MTRHFAIVPAAGSGARFGSEVPKQYLELAGKPMIFHALAALCRCDRVDAVWVVLSPGDEWWASFDWSPIGAEVASALLRRIDACGKCCQRACGNR
jgi:2-C-methyl-D-erythritol 4-phosphate cytidylyltransferase